MNLIKLRGHHHCPASFDPGQQSFRPGKDTKMKQDNNLSRSWNDDDDLNDVH